MRRTLLAVTALAASLAWGSLAQAADQPITMCTGIAKGNYEFVGSEIAQQLGPDNIKLINTAGSVDNLKRVSTDACQMGLAQADALYLFNEDNRLAAVNIEPARVLYPEYAHLICNEKISEISDLKSGDKVLVGPSGSGSAVMWDAIVRANKAYSEVGPVSVDGLERPLGQLTRNGSAKCMLFVSGLKSSLMNEANGYAKNASGLHLTTMRDPKLFALTDAKGDPIYTRATIPSGTYAGGLQTGNFITGSAVDTVKVDSVLFVNLNYANAHGAAYEDLLRAVTSALPSIYARVRAK